jgi:hypothetical protein
MRRTVAEDRLGVGAFYGAFAVVVVATIVIGILIQAVPGPRRPAHGPAEGELADLFLEAILATSEGTAGESVRGAVATLCTTAPCPAGTVPRPRMADNISRAAGPLAHGLGRPWSFAVANSTGVLLSIGDLPPQAPATASRQDIFHRAQGAYLTATVRLGMS